MMSCNISVKGLLLYCILVQPGPPLVPSWTCLNPVWINLTLPGSTPGYLGAVSTDTSFTFRTRFDHYTALCALFFVHFISSPPWAPSHEKLLNSEASQLFVQFVVSLSLCLSLFSLSLSLSLSASLCSLFLSQHFISFPLCAPCDGTLLNSEDFQRNLHDCSLSSDSTGHVTSIASDTTPNLHAKTPQYNKVQ